jgi:hypothetical protein
MRSQHSPTAGGIAATTQAVERMTKLAQVQSDKGVLMQNKLAYSLKTAKFFH